MEGLAQNGELHEILGVAFDIGTEIEHAHKFADCGEEGGNRGPRYTSHGPQLELRHRHQGAGIACRHDGVCVAVGNTGNGHPHRCGLAAPYRLRSGVIGRYGIRRVDDACVRQVGGLCQERRNSGLITIKNDFDLRMLPTGDVRAPHNAGRRVVAAHGVQRQPHLFNLGTQCGKTFQG